MKKLKGRRAEMEKEGKKRSSGDSVSFSEGKELPGNMLHRRLDSQRLLYILILLKKGIIHFNF